MSAVRPEGTGTMDSNAVTSREYVTATIGGQLFGLPILRVQDVFIPERVTRVPLAGWRSVPVARIMLSASVK